MSGPKSLTRSVVGTKVAGRGNHVLGGGNVIDHVLAVSAGNRIFYVGEGREVAQWGAERADLTYYSSRGQLLQLITVGGRPALIDVPWRTTQGEALFRLHRAVLAWASDIESDPTIRHASRHARWLRSISGDLPTFVRQLLGHSPSGIGSSCPPRPQVGATAVVTQASSESFVLPRADDVKSFDIACCTPVAGANHSLISVAGE